ncbi:hypothetical protein KR084_005126 [Drosophila pseudotakahashii]|nr:hypothetical protein KR084_005126 [Drosophila pseudotakahashii]
MPPERKVALKKPNFVWTAPATECLLEMWLENLDDFRGKERKNSDIMREMAHAMWEYDITTVEIKAKMDNMKKKYRKEFQKIRLLKIDRSRWSYFSQMQHIMEYSDDDEEFESDAESIPKSAYKGPIKKESPIENEYSDSAIEFEFPESANKRHKSNGPETEEFTDEEILPNLYSENSLTEEEPTGSIRSGNESDSSADFNFPELNAKRYQRQRANALGEEMLALQRETLNVLRTMAEDLSSFHDKFLRALKSSRQKRSRLS